MRAAVQFARPYPYSPKTTLFFRLSSPLNGYATFFFNESRRRRLSGNTEASVYDLGVIKSRRVPSNSVNRNLFAICATVQRVID